MFILGKSNNIRFTIVETIVGTSFAISYGSKSQLCVWKSANHSYPLPVVVFQRHYFAQLTFVIKTKYHILFFGTRKILNLVVWKHCDLLCENVEFFKEGYKRNSLLLLPKSWLYLFSFFISGKLQHVLIYECHHVGRHTKPLPWLWRRPFSPSLLPSASTVNLNCASKNLQINPIFL